MFGFVLLKVVSNMLPYSGLSDSRKVEKAKARDEKTLLLRYFAGICWGVWGILGKSLPVFWLGSRTVARRSDRLSWLSRRTRGSDYDVGDNDDDEHHDDEDDENDDDHDDWWWCWWWWWWWRWWWWLWLWSWWSGIRGGAPHVFVPVFSFCRFSRLDAREGLPTFALFTPCWKILSPNLWLK